MTGPLVSISIVSHMQNDLVRQLLQDLRQHCISRIEVILTVNVAEQSSLDAGAYGFPVTTIQNDFPKGFGANHNAALRSASGDFFCIMNPDIRLQSDPFPALLESMEKFGASIAAPLVVNGIGQVEESARRFPTPLGIFLKALGIRMKADYTRHGEAIFPDWVGGMFMLIPADVYRQLGGFNEAYFLYYEDVDLCARAALQGYRVVLVPGVSIIHHARRSSHHSLKYLKWHFASICRFFLSQVFFAVLWRRLTGQIPKPPGAVKMREPGS
jgi:N-acetylglucosaminyl-diphospho-decaprenol L-rhamnosyltransferase